MVVIADTPPAISFPGMDPAEEFRFYFHRHSILLLRAIGQLIFWIIVFGLLVYFSGVTGTDDRATARVMIAALCLVFMVPQIGFLVRIYNYHMRIVIVTDKKVHQFKRTLISTDRHESVDLWVLQDIDKTQRGIVQNIFGFGTLKLEAQNTRIKIHFTPKIDKTYERIVQLRESARHRMMPGTEKAPPVHPT